MNRLCHRTQAGWGLVVSNAAKYPFHLQTKGEFAPGTPSPQWASPSRSFHRVRIVGFFKELEIRQQQVSLTKFRKIQFCWFEIGEISLHTSKMMGNFSAKSHFSSEHQMNFSTCTVCLLICAGTKKIALCQEISYIWVGRSWKGLKCVF